MSIDIFCAITERTFHFRWPEDINPNLEWSWHKLGEIIEEEVGGIFNNFPSKHYSSFRITSSKSDGVLIAEVEQLIKVCLPAEQGQEVHIVFWGNADPDTKWELCRHVKYR